VGFGLSVAACQLSVRLGGVLRAVAFLVIPVGCWAGTAEQRAVDYLAREVPKWSVENGCYSCHNDGDGARALFVARERGYTVADEALARTTEWLARPAGWDLNRGNPAASDKKLARIQFAAALGAASRAGLVQDARVLVEAARSVAEHQEKDGSWRVDTGTLAGSPVTYGAVLATYLSREVLKGAGTERFRAEIAKADKWLRSLKPATTFDAAGLLLALPERKDLATGIVASQAGDGGWGPFRGAPSEPFDTAVAMLALKGRREAADAVARGRAYLIQTQLEPGGWPETTRPPGGQSYAQHLSTTAWAALALMSTDAER
jgi:hypothetical protein